MTKKRPEIDENFSRLVIARNIFNVEAYAVSLKSAFQLGLPKRGNVFFCVLKGIDADDLDQI